MLWKVPITVATKGNPLAASLVLSEQSTTVTLEGVGEGDWVLVSDAKPCSNSNHSRGPLIILVCLEYYCNFVCVQ